MEKEKGSSPGVPVHEKVSAGRVPFRNDAWQFVVKSPESSCGANGTCTSKLIVELKWGSESGQPPPGRPSLLVMKCKSRRGIVHVSGSEGMTAAVGKPMTVAANGRRESKASIIMNINYCGTAVELRVRVLTWYGQWQWAKAEWHEIRRGIWTFIHIHNELGPSAAASVLEKLCWTNMGEAYTILLP